MRSSLTRSILCLALLSASWHPAAGQTLARTVSGSSGVQTIGLQVPLGFQPGYGLSSAGSSTLLPGQALPGLGAPGVSLESGGIELSAVPGMPAVPFLPTALPVPAPDAAAAPQALGAQEAVPSQAGEATLLGRTRELVVTISAPASSPQAETLAGVELAKVYDGRASVSAPFPVEAGPSVQAPAAERSSGFLSRLLPASKPEKAAAKRSLVGTGVFKVGMEALGVSMPMIALTMFGSAVWMANMAVTWGLSMTMASMLAGGWMDRKPVHKVMAKAMVVQAVAVAAIMGLFLAGLGSPLLIVPLYAVAGASMGVVVTGRNLLPAKVLGNDHASLGKFNAVTHLVYEVAGTISPLLVGLLISKVGLVAGLFLHPPAYLLAAWLFSRLPLEDSAAPSRAGVPASRSGDWRSWITEGASALWHLAKDAALDVRAGYGVMWKDRAFRWIGVMLLGPMIVHRVFESMLVPFFVKTFLGAPERVAWVVSGSNFGELLGALLLIKTMTSLAGGKPSSPSRWVRPMAFGTLATWALAATGNLWAIIPLVLVMSVTWAANDINLTSYLQSRLPEGSEGKAMGFLMAAELAAILGISYILGFMFDAISPMASLVVVNVAATVLAVVFWRGKKHLKDSTDAPAKSGPPAPAA
ncbi:MAG: MFS transporter [Elusimicrobia bacterium]|nr:MFS transporter [Elusimicrobiota bacterium]